MLSEEDVSGQGDLISPLLDESLVVFLEAKTREEALGELICALKKAGKVKDSSLFLHAVLEREQIMSTGVGLGVAIPHVKSAEYPEFFLAVGVLQKRGVDWKALDGCVARLIFLIGGPENRQTDYLQILSRLTAAIRSEKRRKQILKAGKPREVISLFAGY